MKIRAQVGMVLNLDKCIGCHTCSVTCKNVWTSRDGVEYAWFNNVETKPGIGFPKNWEDQEKWNGGWVRKPNGKLVPKQGGRLKILSNIFANPNLPQIDDYYEPFTYDYEHLQNAPKMKTPPTARPVSVLTGKKMDKVEWGPNWEDDLAGEFEKRAKDTLFEGIQKEMMGAFEQTFMMYLPRLCEHCLNPTCVASCPSGSIYKREDDGIVLIDQDKCRGWRMCVSGCPYKKIYYNWVSGKAEKCIFCYPRIEAGEPTVCSETCVGRIRYLGVLLYDADKIEEAASVENPQDLYEAQLGVFLDPHDPEIQREALKQGISQSWLDAAKKSPVYKMAMEWKIAFPLHPEYRTLPMVWYIPPLSPIQYGEDRDRGSAMVDLLEEYRRYGFELGDDELPDYLPALLEFLSHVPHADAQELLGGAVHVIAHIAENLQSYGSPYAAVLKAAATLSPVAPQPLTEPPVRDMDEAMETFGPDWQGIEPLLKPSVQTVRFYPKGRH